MRNTSSYILGFQAIDKSKLAVVGGKGANLGELARIDGIHVPDGFCVSTEAFKRILDGKPSINELLHQLSLLTVEDTDKLGELSRKIRRNIESAAIPHDIAEAIADYLTTFGEQDAFAVRSSATAEDMPTASFAGQQDTYLNVIGQAAILSHISQCWASLFTERAVIYRLQNGFDHRNVHLSVVVQKMVFPQVAGILFTADPVTSNRKVVSIDASFGLGEALVSGIVNADNYKVRNDHVVEKKIAVKKLAVYAVKHGGTTQQEIETEQQNKQALTDEHIVQLARIGRTIEAHFGSPQDIEWCLVDDTFYIVQSRPITTLYPIPAAADSENASPHVYLSVGHQQMMTDAMKPLGLSLWRLPTMYEAGGRLFVDVTPMLTSPTGRNTIIHVLGRFDPFVKDALTTLVERGDFIPTLPANTDDQPHPSGQNQPGQPTSIYQALNDYDPAVVEELIRRSEASLEELKQQIQTKSGVALLDFVMDDIHRLRARIAAPQSMGVIMTAMNAASWINSNVEEWLGEKAVADTLSQSVPTNVTSQMGLDLLDVADVIRPYPEVITYLQRSQYAGGTVSPPMRFRAGLPQLKEGSFLDELPKYDGGQQARNAIDAFLNRYGMRCAGEIDITRNRWREEPGTLIPMILTNIRNAEPGASKRKFEQGRQEALTKAQELLERLSHLPDGGQKAAATKRMIDLVRHLSGYREYPKYHIVSCYFVYKQALLKEAEGLRQAGVIHATEDSYYLTFDELREVVRTHQLDYSLINHRKDAYKLNKKLTPPRVITSDGEVLTGAYKRENLPADAIVGLAVSSGVVEGRARVVLSLEGADLEEGDILVTAFTDPSWTPLFVSIKGLVTEVGGLMTHGSVIAREYGLPAVVGVENATKRIKDGQRIRVHGTEGYIEIQ